MSAELTYATVRAALTEALPAFGDPVARLEAEWADDPAALGEYIVFEDVFGAYFEVLLSIAPSACRDRLLARSFAFLERLMSAADRDVVNLGAVGVCERLECLAAWRALADRFAGPATRRTLDPGAVGAGSGEVIDLWGVREALAAEGLELAGLPGVSHPAEHRRLQSLDEARSHPEGVTILSSFGTSSPLLVAPAAGIRASAAALAALAGELARDLGGEETEGDPRAHFFAIPPGERVWRMHRGDEEHGRLGDDLWLHPDLAEPASERARAIVLGSSRDTRA
ncbi:MAG: hypothetical protein QOJ85_2606 [Solirubrobacteraceae bacterium]|nr:hypothetical protein [Solirubrobacteraceae bacterium]